MSQEDITFQKLLKNVKLYNPNADTKLLKKAYEFASIAHHGQKRRTGDPFIFHILEVVRILIHWEMDTTTLTAALLHDTIEDGAAKREDIKEEFGEEVLEIVEGVTKVSKVHLKGSTDEIFIETLRKMILVMAKDLRVVFVKLADRIHNMRTLDVMPQDKQLEKSRESLEIYALLAERLGVREAKAILENLAFPYIYPDEYARVVKSTKKYFENADKHLAKFQSTLRRELKKAKINGEIVGRKKNYYSLWKKLQRPNIDWDLEKVHDLLALRIITAEVTECYQALGIVHKLWKPVPHLGVSDFIAQPKPNGYQSIHTKVFAGGGIMEVQIRTRAMHEQAEHGVAAHWHYAESKSKDVKEKDFKKGFSVDNKLNWVQELVKWQKEMIDSKEFLDSVKFDAFQHRNFVFSPKGDVYDLPRSATPVDFAYQVHTDLGNYIIGAKVNGKMVPLDSKLVSGDIVEIVKSRHPRKPSQDWLKFVVTTQAKNGISKSLRKNR